MLFHNTDHPTKGGIPGVMQLGPVGSDPFSWF